MGVSDLPVSTLVVRITMNDTEHNINDVDTHSQKTQAGQYSLHPSSENLDWMKEHYFLR